jgi:hypothetical protein
MQKRQRPTGVTIITILTIMIGIILLIAGISLFVVGALTLNNHFHMTTTNSTNFYAMSHIFGIIGISLGVVLLVIGVAYVVMFYGLLKGRGWAWTITVILLFIGIAIQIISTAVGGVFTASFNNDINSTDSVLLGLAVALLGIITNIATLYYLYRPHIKSYFGKTTGSAS